MKISSKFFGGLTHEQSKLFLCSACFVLILLGLVVPAFAAEGDILSDPNPVKIKGDSVEYFYKENRAEGRGGIHIDYAEWSLTAEEVDVKMDTKEAWARGDVVLTQPGAKYEGDDVYVNFDTGVAEVSDMKASIAPFYRGESESVKKTADEYYVLENSYLTTCDEDQVCDDGTPYYRMDAGEILYYPNQRIVLKDVVLRLANMPILYFPVLVIPIDRSNRYPIQVELGNNKEWGAFALTKFRYYVNDEHDGNVLLDYRENQGLAYGLEHYTKSDALGQSTIRTYFADDDCGAEDQDCSRSGTHVSNESSRYRVQLRHRSEPIRDTALNVEINKLSDKFVLQDFFYREEFERIAFPDNYVSLIHADEKYTLSALTRFRLDDFVGVVERTPEIRFDTHTKRIADSNFYYRSETQGSVLNRTFKDVDTNEDHESLVRLDTRNRVSYVQKIGSWTATPYVGLRNTLYTRSSDGLDRDFVRNSAEAGIDISTKFFKVYEVAFNRWGIEFEKIRHVFTPNVSYAYQSMPTHRRQDLYQFDQLDNLDHSSQLVLDFENKLQVKYLENTHGDSQLQARDLLRSIISFELDMPQSDETRLGAVMTELDFYPYSWLHLGADAEYHFETDQVEGMNADMSIVKDPFRIGFGQRYINGTSNQSTLHFEWDVTEDWKFGVYERFDFMRSSSNESERNNEFEISVQKRNFFCWTIKLTYNRSHRENSFFVTFSPTSFPETSFRRGQSYRGL